MKENIKGLTFKEIEEKLTKCELVINKIKNGEYKNIETARGKLIPLQALKETLQAKRSLILAEASKPVEYINTLATDMKRIIDGVTEEVSEYKTTVNGDSFVIGIKYKSGDMGAYKFSLEGNILFVKTNSNLSKELGPVSSDDTGMASIKSNLETYIQDTKRVSSTQDQIAEERLSLEEKKIKEKIVKGMKSKSKGGNGCMCGKSTPKDKKLAEDTDGGDSIIVPKGKEREAQQTIKKLTGVDSAPPKPGVYKIAETEGHGNEASELKPYVYEIAKASAILYKKLNEAESMGEGFDLPNWVQAKIIIAKEAITRAQEYIEYQSVKPALDSMALEGRKIEKKRRTPEPEERKVPSNLKLRGKNPSINEKIITKKKSK